MVQVNPGQAPACPKTAIHRLTACFNEARGSGNDKTRWPDQILNYRADIDGLRAVAVLSVVVYHLGNSVGFNGYLGVDIFFVISGYLITAIIKQEVADGTFTFGGFYMRRIRRIIPILLVVLTVSTVAALLLFLPSELKLYAKSVIATLFFVSNILFYSESGYFDADAELKPLLHTWSLSVEEQFYIVFPLLLLFALRRGPAPARAIIALLFLMSLTWNLLFPGIFTDTSFAFFMFPVRAWELLAGSALALGLFPKLPERRRLSEGLGVLAVLLILAGFLPRYPEEVPYVFQTLPTVLGAALIIALGAQAHKPLLSRVLSLRYVTFIGKISYSLYLWHWPIFVFAAYYGFGRLSDPVRVGLILLSLLLSALSWKYIEEPFRRSRSRRLLRWSAAGACALPLILVICSVSILRTNGVLPWMPENIATLAVAERLQNFNTVTDEAGQSVITLDGSGDTGSPSVLLVGDSHAEAVHRAVAAAAETKNRSVIRLGNSCFATFEELKTDRELSDCVDATRAQLRYILERPELKTIVIAQRWQARTTGWHTKSGVAAGDIWTLRLESLLDYVEALTDAGREVIVLAQVPLIETRLQNVPSIIARMEMWDSDELDSFGPTEDRYLSYNANMLDVLRTVEERSSAAVIYPHQVFCSNGACQVYDAEGVFYYDDDHLSVYGANKLIDEFTPLF